MEDQKSVVQQQLDGYAQSAATGEGLDRFLTGDALESALQSAALMQSLGYQQLGVSKLTLESLDRDSGAGCLDLSQVRIVDAEGELVQPNRPDRLSFQVELSQQGLISSLKVGSPC